MLVDSFIKYLVDRRSPYLPQDYNIWYVGIENSIDMGINELLVNLNKNGQIIIGEPEIVDYIYDDYDRPGYDLIYVILYKSLSKLEYLEYKWQEKVDKHGKAPL
jgi:hypothetical protein